MDKSDIEKLNQLKEKNILTEEEFNAEKAKILNKAENKKEEEIESSDFTTTNITENTSYSNEQINQNSEKAQTKPFIKVLERIIYITAAVAIACICSVIGLLVIMDTRIDYGVLNYIEVLTTVSGFTLISWFTSSVIYMIIMIKNGLMPKIRINVLIWIIGVLEIAGSVKNYNNSSIVIIVAIVGLIILQLVTMMSAENKKKLIYRCPECRNKIEPKQAECPKCKTKIDWD